MADLVVLVPSRGRPGAAADLAQAFAETTTADTGLVFVVDDNDETGDGYVAAVKPFGGRAVVLFTPARTMVEALNFAAAGYSGMESRIGFMGDDHRPRSTGWDAEYVKALDDLGTGIVYGNDLLQGMTIPTQCAMTADVVTALGYMAPPALTHLFVDDAWKAWGEAIGRIRYLPDVIVEHVHPLAGKVGWDDGHTRVNAPEMYQRDAEAYTTYRNDQLPTDVARLRGLTRSAGQSGPGEWRLFDEGTVPVHTTSEWYAGREHAPHLEQAQHQGRLHRTAALVKYAAATLDAATVVDLGSGDGGLLSLLDPELPAWGFDLQPTNLESAKVRGVDVRYGDVVIGEIEWGRIAVATEMIEHLVDPHSFVRRIAGHAEVLVCSSPWTERPDNAYEFHTWCWDLDGYRALIEQGGFRVVRQDVVGAFQVLLAVRS